MNIKFGKTKIFPNFFKKPIDKSSGLCYNNLRKVERTTKRKGENKNDKPDEPHK